MVSWISVADLHLRENDRWGLINPETGLNFRLEDRLNNLKESVDYAIKKKVDLFVILGDIFHTLNPGENLRALFYDAIRGLASKGIKIYVLIGNHDTNGTVYNFIGEKVADIESTNFFVISELLDVDNFVFIPYGWEAQIREIKDKRNKVLFSHFVVDGAEVGPCSYKLQSSYPLRLLKDFKWFELGDIHKPQEFENGCYVGSIAKNDFGERDEEKGFRYSRLIDAEVKTEFVAVDDRRFIQIDVNEDNYKDKLSGLGSDNRGAVCKIVVTGTREFIKSVDWTEYRLFFKQCCALVRFEYIRTDAEKRGKLISAKDPFSASIEGMISEYAKSNQISDNDLEFGLKLLGESS